MVKNIRPEFIGGINVMTSFGIKLMDVNNIDAVLVNQSYTDLARVQKALECAGKEQNEEIIQMIKKVWMYIHGFKIRFRIHKACQT